MTDDERIRAVALRASAIERIFTLHRVPWSWLTLAALLVLVEHKKPAEAAPRQQEIGLHVHPD